MTKSTLHALLLLFALVCTVSCFAGGPIVVGSPFYGVDGKPYAWSPNRMPIQYRVDPGPMSATATGTTVISNSAGLQRLQSMFSVWQSVPTASLSFGNAGGLQATGAYQGGDVKTVAQYDALVGACQAGTQNPIVFDADGSIFSELVEDGEVIGFASLCSLDTSAGYITGAMVVLNGKFQDNVNSSSNYELGADQYDEAITHEIGHFVGLDHSQINLDLLDRAINGSITSCPLDDLAGLPLMFPIEFCQPRKTAGLPVLAPDDVSWISKLYPKSTQASSYGTISGYILFSDGVTPVQGVNVIARAVDDPYTSKNESRSVAVSVVSGYLFTDSIGSFTVGTDPSAYGSRNPEKIGYYEISVPPGSYTIEVESVDSRFEAGSSVGPLNPPVPIPGQGPEFWNNNESSSDNPALRDTVTVQSGQKLTDINIILNGTPARFDVYEDSGSLLNAPLHEILNAERVTA